MKSTYLSVFAFAILVAVPACAASRFSGAEEARSLAVSICGNASAYGSRNDGSGGVTGKIDVPALKGIIDLGFEFKGRGGRTEWNGVAQEQVAQALKDSMGCRERMFKFVTQNYVLRIRHIRASRHAYQTGHSIAQAQAPSSSRAAAAVMHGGSIGEQTIVGNGSGQFEGYGVQVGKQRLETPNPKSDAAAKPGIAFEQSSAEPFRKRPAGCSGTRIINLNMGNNWIITPLGSKVVGFETGPHDCIDHETLHDNHGPVVLHEGTLIGSQKISAHEP